MRKAQITMEALLLYGAAILVVLLAIAALIYFGVLDLGGLLPQRCNIESSGLFKCDEYRITDGKVELVLMNKGTRSVTVYEAEFVPNDEGVLNSASGSCSEGVSINIVPGGSDTITINCDLNDDIVGKRIAGQIRITHKYTGGELDPITSVGELSATVTASS